MLPRHCSVAVRGHFRLTTARSSIRLGFHPHRSLKLPDKFAQNRSIAAPILSPRRRHSASVIGFDVFPVSRYSGPLHVLRAGLHLPLVPAVPAVPSAQRDGTSRSTSKLGLGDTETPKNQKNKARVS